MYILYSLPSSQVVVPRRRHVVVTGTGGAENRCEFVTVSRPPPHALGHYITSCCSVMVRLEILVGTLLGNYY